MAQLWTTGPAHIFVSVAGQSQIQYLGTCQEKPRIEIRRSRRPVRNDLGGDVPFDTSYMGQDAMIGLDLNRYNESVYAQIADAPTYTATRGVDIAGSIGTLETTELDITAVWVQFPYSSFAAFAGMPPGYRFPYCRPMNDLLDPIGTVARVTHLMFHALRGYDPVAGGQLLYDSNMAGLPSPN